MDISKTLKPISIRIVRFRLKENFKIKAFGDFSHRVYFRK